MQSIGNRAGGDGVEAALAGDGKGGMGHLLSATYVAQRVLLL